MASYLTVERFKLLTTIPDSFVTEIEAISPGFTLAQLEYFSDWLNAQLTKRYAVPFVDPAPSIVEMWVTRIVTPRVWSKRGVNPTDEQFQEVKKDDTDARAEIDRAANAETGLFELPLRSNTTISGVTKGFTRGYSEQSPYVHTTIQADRARQEDDSGFGSST